MDINSLFSAENMAAFIGGLIIILYAVWQILFKIFGNIGWIKEKRQAKEEKKKEEKRKEITDLVEESIVPPILERINTINNEQNIKLDKLLKSSNDTLREDLLKIYFKYRPYKKIPQWARESAEKLHDDYVAQDGNSFVEDLWRQIVTWEMVPSDEEVDD